MHASIGRIMVMCLALGVSTTATAEQLAPGVWGQVLPRTPGEPGPAVIVLHGRAGLYPEWTEYGRRLGQNGFVAMVLEYQHETGSAPRRELIREFLPAWVETIRAATRYLESRPDVAAGRIALLGFSLGGFVAVRAAGEIPEVGAVVVYYGGGTSTLSEYVSRLPPTLILHGDEDGVVPVTRGVALYDAMRQAGRVVELKRYPGVAHCFDCSITQPRKADAAAAADAEQATLRFLRSQLLE